MNLDKLTQPTVRAAIKALQDGDKAAWSALFTDDAKLYDDGKPRDLTKFSADTLGHEHFTSIDTVENDSRDLYGSFHSDTYGDFRTYFKFGLTEDGKIERLEIGKA